jgi:hypothetical protein
MSSNTKHGYTRSYTFASAIAAALVTGACASLPADSAPTVGVLPGGGKDMAQFNLDDIACRSVATAKAKENSPLPVAMGLGNRIEVASTRTRPAIRANTESTGSVFGNAVATDNTAFTRQQRYDTAYVSCMYSKGHKIPVGEALSG